MLRESGQDRFKFEACVNVVVILLLPGIDDIPIGHTKTRSNILECWWVEPLQETCDVLNGGFAFELNAYHEGMQLLPFRRW